MLKVSDSILNAYKKYKTQRKSYIKVNDKTFFIENLEVTGDVYNEGNIIGNAIAKIAHFDIETINVKNIDEFELFDGIWTGNQYEYVSLGTFKLFDESGVDDFFTTITAYDKLINFNSDYDPSLIPFPIPMYDFLVEICKQGKIELLNTSIPNGDKIIQENIFVEGEKLKQILCAICQINGCFGIVSGDKLKLLLKNDDCIILDKSQISNPDYKRTTWKINQVILGMSDVEGEYSMREDKEDIEKNGVHKIVINDNPFVYSQDLREEYIDNLFNQVKGFGYIAFEAAWEGMSFVELGDSAIIDGKESIILRYTLKSPKGLESSLSAPSIIDSVINYVNNSNSIKNQQSRTEYKVDKANRTITSIVSNANEQNEKISKVEQNVDGISSQVTSIDNKVNDIDEKVDENTANFNDFKNNEYLKSIKNLQDQIDGAIQFWKGNEIPTLNNYPASDWTTNVDKDNHLGDIYYLYGEEESGKTIAINGYRFDNVDEKYQWIILSDTELAAVQKLAEEAKDKANSVEQNLKNNYSTTTQMNTAIQASVGQQIKDAEGNILNNVDGQLKLYIKKGTEGKDDVISAFNLNANEVEIDSDNFKLDKTGHVEAYDMLLKGGKLDLIDDGTKEDASITITRHQRIIGTKLKVGDTIKGYMKLNPGLIGFKPFLDQLPNNTPRYIFYIDNTSDGLYVQKEVIGNNYYRFYFKGKMVGVFIINTNNELISSDTVTMDLTSSKGSKITSIADWGADVYEFGAKDIFHNLYQSAEEEGELVDLKTTYSSSGVTIEQTDKHNYTRQNENGINSAYSDYQFLMGIVTKNNNVLKEPKKAQLERYDLDNDGIITNNDALEFISLDFYQLSDGEKMNIELNTNEYQNPLKIYDDNKNYQQLINLLGHSIQLQDYESYGFSNGYGFFFNSNDVLAKFGLESQTNTMELLDTPTASNHAIRLQDIEFQKGETFAPNGDIVLSGYISSSTKTLYVNYTFPKSVRGLNIQITSFKAAARSIKGYLNSQSGYQNFLASGYTVSVIKNDDCNVRIDISKTSAFTNVDNNTPVCLQANITFKFS